MREMTGVGLCFAFLLCALLRVECFIQRVRRARRGWLAVAALSRDKIQKNHVLLP